MLDKIKYILIGAWDMVRTKFVTFFETEVPDEKERKTVYGVIILTMVLLWYMIAILHLGIWVGVWTPWALIWAYLVRPARFPFILFLLLGAAAFWIICLFVKSSDEPAPQESERPISDSNTYGSARIATEQEISQVAQIGTPLEVTGPILGKLDASEEKLIANKPLSNFNGNILGLAPPGFGKTFTFVLNYVTQSIMRGESCITTDTKGEVFAKTMELARLHGYKIFRVDFKNPENSDGWNILKVLRSDPVRTQNAARIIMKNSENADDPHISAEEALLRALCLYVSKEPKRKDQERTLYEAASLIKLGYTNLDTKFKALENDEDLGVAYENYATTMQGSERLRSNVLQNLANRLSILSIPAYKNLTSTDDVDLTLPGKEKCLIYVELPDQHDSTRFLASLFFSFLFYELVDLADSNSNQRLDIPVNVMIEEAYAVGQLPSLTNALSTVRSRGINIALVAQGLSQFRILYGEDVTNIIINSCGTFFCLGAASPDTTNLFSWMAGEATIHTKTEHHTVGESPVEWGRTYTTGQGRQKLFTEDDIRKIPFGRVLIIWTRLNPVLGYTFGIDRHPEYLNGHMPLTNGVTKIPLSDKVARAYIRQREQERIDAYNAWIERGGNPWQGYVRAGMKNAQYSNEPIPPIIPYETLEKEALEYSKNLPPEDKKAMIKAIQKTPEFSLTEYLESLSKAEQANAAANASAKKSAKESAKNASTDPAEDNNESSAASSSSDAASQATTQEDQDHTTDTSQPSTKKKGRLVKQGGKSKTNTSQTNKSSKNNENSKTENQSDKTNQPASPKQADSAPAESNVPNTETVPMQNPVNTMAEKMSQVDLQAMETQAMPVTTKADPADTVRDPKPADELKEATPAEEKQSKAKSTNRIRSPKLK